MAPGHVAYGLRAQYGLFVDPETVVAWERGLAVPGEQELTALAGVLWCSPAELIAAPTSLREHRVARGLSVEELARRTGVSPAAYQRMEDEGRWNGTERQTLALGEALGLGPRALVTATGGDEPLAELLRDAATTRWQAYVKPAAKLVPLPKRVVEAALRELHAEYHARMVAISSWGRAAEGTGDEGRAYLDGITGHFWAAVGP
ncbi:helix-turn-helix domain-containing protein [Streptomyces sp. NPDC055815]